MAKKKIASHTDIPALKQIVDAFGRFIEASGTPDYLPFNVNPQLIQERYPGKEHFGYPTPYRGRVELKNFSPFDFLYRVKQPLNFMVADYGNVALQR